ncbi:hypothetical protein OUZ56_026166 [Daphnia magna]|uniref:Uncharacterized protein n=1 Tax=Daphnia magna TaxID=35525 RepID=A0ABQ9ZLF6_9CRUS|nr:hypothetical protein OUZ56_026166 [Daphnia magna]
MLFNKQHLNKYKLIISQCIHIEHKRKNSWYHSVFTLNTRSASSQSGRFFANRVSRAIEAWLRLENSSPRIQLGFNRGT